MQAVEQHSLNYGATSTTVTPTRWAESVHSSSPTMHSRRVNSYSAGGFFPLRRDPRIRKRLSAPRHHGYDERGIATTSTYDSHHLVSRTEAVGTPRARTTSYLYASTDSDLITQITEPNRITTFSV